MSDSATIQSVSQEKRRFEPPASFVARTRLDKAAYEALHRKAAEDHEGYWAEQARLLKWSKPFTKLLEWNEPFAKWFSDGKINASVNCLDRHLATHGNKAAIIFEGEPGDERTLTYSQL